MTRLHALLDRYARALLGHRAAFFVAGLLVSLLMIGAALRVRVDFTIQELFTVDDPELDYLRQHRQRYGADDDLAALLVVADDVFAPAVLRFVDRLSRRLEQLEQVRQVDSLTTVSDLRHADQGLIDTRALFHRIPDDPAALGRLRRRALDSPLIRGRLVGADGGVTAVVVRLAEGIERAGAVRAAVQRIARAVKRARPPRGVTLQPIGVPIVRTEAIELIKLDQLRFIPITSVLTMVILLVLYRSFHGVVIPLAAIGLSMGYTIGLMSLVGQPLDILSNILPVLVMVYGVADAVHILARVHEQMRAGDARDLALRVAVRHLGLACLLTSVTTAIGFGSLLSSEMAILRRFGTFAAAGVLLAYLVTMLAVPLGVSILGVDPARTARHTASPRMRALLAGVADLVVRRPGLVLALGAALAVAGVGLGRKVVVDNFLLGVYHDDHPTARATRLAERQLTGMVTLQLALRGERGALKRPPVLRALGGIERWLRDQPGVTGTLSPALFVEQLHRAVVGEAKIPDDPRAVSQLLLLAEGQSGEGDTGLQRLVDYGYGRGRVVISLRDIGARRYLALARALRQRARAALAPLEVKTHVTGTSLIAYRGINRLVTNLLESLAIALGLIGLVLILAFRSIKVGLVSLIPNVIPLATGLAFMAAAQIRLEPTTVMIYCIALGIAVDDTIHYVVRYREECAAGRPPAEATRAALLTTGRAMTVTSLVLVLGFAVVLVSNFPNTQRFGLLGCVILAAAWITDMLVTPACMLVFGVGRQRRPAQAARDRSKPP